MSYEHVFGNVLHILVNVSGFREKYQKPWITGLIPLPNIYNLHAISELATSSAIYLKGQIFVCNKTEMETIEMK